MKNALVIDDNKFAAEAIAEMVGLLDFRVQIAYGARSAILTLEMFTPDVVFLDINMPGLSGFELLGYLKRDPRTSAIPVVVISAEDDAGQAVAQGALAALIKPTSVDEIEAVLRSAGIITE